MCISQPVLRKSGRFRLPGIMEQPRVGILVFKHKNVLPRADVNE